MNQTIMRVAITTKVSSSKSGSNSGGYTLSNSLCRTTHNTLKIIRYAIIYSKIMEALSKSHLRNPQNPGELHHLLERLVARHPR